MTGTWLGYYQYDNQEVQHAVGFEKTFFTLTITAFDGSRFTGTVQDDVASGGMKETGKIEGTLVNQRLRFEKRMPKWTLITDAAGTRETHNAKHPTLYYAGTLSEGQTVVEGRWKFGFTFGLLWGIIPVLYRPAKGIWRMQREAAV